ncbi:PHP domain-containing protein [Halobaculum lipolyticum]|uniref:histidinol-phosphatase n=1 Tax=Halobaculum lipolyticum TaxID=3032001 RepID=A0ABD5WCC5_9EURY|nr:PHP domain-containing protein [Halobaculum sp. DT31]
MTGTAGPSTDPARFYDLHTHTRFSDGSPMAAMVSAAADAGCDGVGLTDHCVLVDDEFGRRAQYDLVETYARRRERIDDLRGATDLRVFDAVELSYVPGTDDEIGSFLGRAGFDYAIGAVHFAGEYGYTSDASYADADDARIRAAVDAYYEALVALIDSELFDVVAHLDLPERRPVFRGVSTPAHYRAVADALADSRTVPEVNAGRVFESLGRVHPDPDLLDEFADRGVEFVLGTDAHTPEQVRRRVPYLREFVAERTELATRSLPPAVDDGTAAENRAAATAARADDRPTGDRPTDDRPTGDRPTDDDGEPDT